MVTDSLNHQLIAHAYPDLLRQFPALYQIVISQGAKSSSSTQIKKPEKTTRQFFFAALHEPGLDFSKVRPKHFSTGLESASIFVLPRKASSHYWLG